MTTPLFCVLIAFLFNYLSKIPLAMAMAKEGKGYDNKTPREQQARLQGWGRRAWAAHYNSFEVTPLFAACVFVGHLTQGNAFWSTILAVTFLVSRVVYTYLYLANRDALRSLVWFIGILSSFGIALSGWY